MEILLRSSKNSVDGHTRVMHLRATGRVSVFVPGRWDVAAAGHHYSRSEWYWTEQP